VLVLLGLSKLADRYLALPIRSRRIEPNRIVLMPDHVLHGRDPSGVAFAYCYGYIEVLIDALVPRL
jgi:hypothetical protein